ncbi:MAG: sigma-70 family RNA polymerase sigma factor [Myxococcales bacterium]|nr:sigma-70 family RNA polymerase sigma factor [Myxococcales bacterium]
MGHVLPFVEDSLRAYLNDIQLYPKLDRAGEVVLAERWRTGGDVEAAHALVCANLRYVVKIAYGFRGYGLRVADLIAEGNIGLLEAVNRFDPARGRRFMTYATYWIRAFLLAHVLKQWSMVGVGTGPVQSKLFFRLARERARLSSELGDVADLDARLARQFSTTPERVRAMAGRLEGKDHSLDAQRFHDGKATALEQLVDQHAGTEEHCADAETAAIVRNRVAHAMKTLSPRERYIVDRRLLTDDAQTLAEIGRHLGLSRERVRQLEERVKQKLGRVLGDLDPAPEQRVA